MNGPRVGEVRRAPAGDEGLGAGRAAGAGPAAPGRAREPAAREVTAWLRARRGGDRSAKFLYAVYVGAIMVLGWYGLFAFGVYVRIRDGHPLAGYADRILPALPSAVFSLGLAAFLLLARDALWRGPVTPPRADTDWLLALPVRRGPLVLPWFALSLGIAVLAALLAGFLGALLLAAAGLGDLWPLAAACSGPAAGLAVIGTVGAAAVEGSERWARQVQRCTPLAVVLLVLLAGQSALAVTGHRLPWLESVELWLGPWGWAAQPALALAGGRAPYWPLATALLAVAVLAAALCAVRTVTTIPAAELRARSRASGGVATGIMTLDPRAARLTAAQAVRPRAAGRTARWCARRRPPRSPRLLIPWRDALALLAEPKRPGATLLLGLVIAGIAAFGAGTHSGAPYGLTALCALLGSQAAAQLLEPARLDADDSHRTAWSPLPYERHAPAHAVTPVLTLLAIGWLVSLPALPAYGPAVLLYAAGAAPLLVAGGLLSAYRSPAPLWILASGAQVAPQIVAIWYAIGPLLAAASLTAAFGGGPTLGGAAICWGLSLAMLRWARLRARRVAWG